MGFKLKNWHFSIWHHPHHYAASIVAKLATNLATMLWALTVLVKANALEPSRFSFYELMLQYAPEDAYGWGAMAFSLIGTYRILAKSKPHWWGGIGYLIQMCFWLYIAITYVLLSPLPLRPATAAWVIVGAILSVYAFVANPRTAQDATSTIRK